MDVILTHEQADFDAVASQVGLARLLPDAVAVLSQTLLEPVRDFLVLYGRELPLITRDALSREPVGHAWLVDTRSAQPVRGMTATTPRTVLDHHSQANAPIDSAVTLQVEAVGATSTLVVERLEAAGIVLGAIEATLLLLGIHDDTGSLTYAYTTPRDLRAAAWLLGQGADLDILQQFLRRPATGAERQLTAALTSTAELLELAGRRLIVATGRLADETVRLAHVAGQLLDDAGDDIEAVILVIDLGDRIQLVARSRSDAVDVGALAQLLGGGGHRRAAAAVVRGGRLAGVTADVRGRLPEVVQPAARVADLMSPAPIRTLAADLSIGDALRLARRYGHEGYPVLAGGAVLGVVTRRDLDLAAHHHLSHAPLSDLLGGSVASVSPHDSVAQLQAVMMEHDLGQVPVLQAGRLVGIVTRTDVLAYWARHSARRGAGTPNVDLDAALPEPWRAPVAAVAAASARLGWRCFLVGGVVRDLLLGRPLGKDIDVVIEGDALAVADVLAADSGGRLRRHPTFGTAAWRTGDLAVDLITARSEYYDAPSSLPHVEPGSLAADLRRRDFSVNALAIDLQPEQRGRIIDPYHGLADLRLRRIRVLHRLSFIEDPTRILRAERYAARLGFELEPDTAELVQRALPYVAGLSAARLRNELLRVFDEPAPATVLAALVDRGVLDAIVPGLAMEPRLGRRLRELPEAWRRHVGGAPTPTHGLLLWLITGGVPGATAGERLKLSRTALTILDQTRSLMALETLTGANDVPASALWRALAHLRPEALALAEVATRSARLRRHLHRFAQELAPAERPVTGADLAELGLPPGPAYGPILEAVWVAWLDGRLPDRSAALAMARELATSTAGPSA